MIELHDFLETIFEGRDADEHILIGRMITNDGGGSFKHSPHDSATVRAWANRSARPAIYFNVSTVAAPVEDFWRRRKQDCLMAYILVLDDVGTKANTPPVEPTYKLESSAGNFQWGYLIDPTDDLSRYEAIVDAVAALGFADAGAAGYNRLMRVPGSVTVSYTHLRAHETV